MDEEKRKKDMEYFESLDEKAQQEMIENAAFVIEQKFNKLYESANNYSPGTQELFEFVKLSNTDDSIVQKIKALENGTLDDFIALGKEKGFCFNEDDIKVFSDCMSDEENDELDGVAGGLLSLVILTVVMTKLYTVPFIVGFIDGVTTSKPKK